MNLPFVTAQFRAPDVHMPGREDFANAAETVRSQLPPWDQSLFYGVLGLGTVFSLIDWPVALAIGAGTALVGRSKQESSR